MNIETCIKERRSVRKFADTKVELSLMEDIIDLARFAPSWKNSQTARYHLIDNEDMKNDIADNCVLGFVYNAKSIKNAPMLVVLTAITGVSGYEEDGSFTTSKEDRWEVFDSGIACQTFCLAAHSKGLGTVIQGIFDETAVAKSLKLAENEKVMALIPVGYPLAAAKDGPPRLEVSQLISYNK